MSIIRKGAIGLSLLLVVITLFVAGPGKVHYAVLNSIFFMGLVWFGTFLNNKGRLMISGALVLAFAGFIYWVSITYALHGYRN